MRIHQAKFVCASDSACASPIFMKKINVDSPEQSEIEISGLGFFELYINGKKVSDDVLVPPVSDYGKRDLSTLHYPIRDTFSHRVYYCRYALDGYLTCGENFIEVWLGGGYYCQDVCNGEGERTYGCPILAFSLTADGKEYLSDETMTWRESTIVWGNLYTGETHDFRHVDLAEKPVALVTRHLGELCESDAPHDRIVRRIRPTVVFRDGARTVYDAGVNLAGAVSFTQRAARGEKTVVNHAEMIDGSYRLLTASAGQILQSETYISDGNAHICMPKFVFHGFRYFEIIGNAEDVWVCEIHSDMPLRVRFHSDNAVLNFLFRASVQSLYSNMHAGVITDCPHREKLGYTGDGQLTADLALTVLDSEKFYEKWLRDIADGQDPDSGHVQHTAPFAGGGGGPGGWGGAIVIVPYMLGLHHDRTDLWRRYYPNMKKYISYMESRCENGLVVREEERGWCLGDWCTPDKVTIPEPFVNTYFLIKCLDDMTEIAEALGDEGAPWREKASLYRARLKESYYDPAARTYCGGIQGADAFAADIGLADGELLRAIADKYERLGAFDTGIFGTDILIRVLFHHGYGDTAMKLLTSEKENSFGAWLRRGETSLCEYWSGIKSHNHHMFGAPLRYVFSYALGVDDRGDSLVVAPAALSAPIELDAEMETKYGRIFVQRTVSEAGESFTVRADVPVRFRYRDTALDLKANEETVLHFSQR